ncbi:MAG: ATP-binding protein [Phycisphaeraceae bacterium]|nr:ATP-binding protein [Phycisphaeraceae bacterium]
MAKATASSDDYPSIARRLTFLGIYSIGLYVAVGLAAGLWKPTGGGEWLWWMSAIALYTVSTLSAPFFIRPRDSLANALVSAPMLFTVDLSKVATLGAELGRFRWVSLGVVLLAAVLSAIAIALQASSTQSAGLRGIVSRASYKVSVPLGNEAVMFTPPALISIIGFYQQRPAAMLWLAALWVLIVTIKPVQLLMQCWDVLWSGKSAKAAPELVGQVARVDDPNIIRVTLFSRSSWKPDRLHKARLAGERQVAVIPLFVQTQDDQLTGTGLCCDGKAGQGIGEGQVWTCGDGESVDDTIKSLAGADTTARLAGFIVECSTIAAISFEVAHEQTLVEGSVVFVRDRDQTVYYQVLNAETKEELFTQNPRGTHVVIAGQLGIRDDTGRFNKYGWVPPMNAPVFLPVVAAASATVAEDAPDEFTLGTVAQTGMKIKASLTDLADYHTAVLGVTGTGKTELVLDMIRAHVKAGRKVFCVDCTGEYEPRLADLSPTKLGFDAAALTKLDELVNATEHGAYGGADEKKKLHEWVTSNRAGVDSNVDTFMTDDSPCVGLFDIPDIANTRATLRATEMYISAIFAWAKKNRKARDVVVVLEEAHTVVPETSLYRFDKADTDAVVGRMAQIALQGRKYGVGLLLVSQRTALVSKTLLSQCNTSICFAMYDKTGLDYLSSMFPSEHVRAIPNLRFLQGIAFGKAVKSERPIIFEIPHDSKKLEASKALNKKPDRKLDTTASGAAAPEGTTIPASECGTKDDSLA